MERLLIALGYQGMTFSAVMPRLVPYEVGILVMLFFIFMVTRRWKVLHAVMLVVVVAVVGLAIGVIVLGNETFKTCQSRTAQAMVDNESYPIVVQVCDERKIGTNQAVRSVVPQ